MTTTTTQAADPIVDSPDPLAPLLPTEPPQGEDFDRAWRPWQIRDVVDRFLARTLHEGSDFGPVPIKHEDKKKPGTFYYTQSKPVLFKPGAEKLCQWAQLRAHYEPGPMQLLDQLKTNRAAVLRCDLLTRWGEIVGEGLGAGALAEPGKKWDNNPNSLIKIMKKRALVDAVLGLFAISERFTQDLEDFPKGLDADPGDESAPGPDEPGDPGWDDMAVNRANPTEGKQRAAGPSAGAVRTATAAATTGSTVRGPNVQRPKLEVKPPTTVKEASEVYSALCYQVMGISEERAEADPGAKKVVSDFAHNYRDKCYGPQKGPDGTALRPPLTLAQYLTMIQELVVAINAGKVPQL